MWQSCNKIKFARHLLLIPEETIIAYSPTVVTIFGTIKFNISHISPRHKILMQENSIKRSNNYKLLMWQCPKSVKTYFASLWAFRSWFHLDDLCLKQAPQTRHWNCFILRCTALTCILSSTLKNLKQNGQGPRFPKCLNGTSPEKYEYAKNMQRMCKDYRARNVQEIEWSEFIIT